MDNGALWKVRLQGAEPQAQLPQDVLPQALPVLPQVAEAPQAAAQMMQAQRRVVPPWLKQQTRVQMLRASRQQELRQSDASPDERRWHPQVRQDAQHPKRLQDQLREPAGARPVSQQPPEQQAPRRQRASRRRPQAQQEPQRQASPRAFLLPSLSRPFPPLQLLQQPRGRGNACAPVPRASGQSSSSASFFP
jgi:hypothetical protein